MGEIDLLPEELEKRIDFHLTGIPPESVITTYCDGETCNLSKELDLTCWTGDTGTLESWSTAG